jgi:hypothetical protein
VLDKVQVVRTGTSRIFSKWSLGGLVHRLKSHSAAAMNCSSEFSISFPAFPLFVIAARGHGWCFSPFFPPLAPFLVPLMVILGVWFEHSRLSQSEGGSDSLLTRGMLGCDVEQLLGGLWLLVGELMNQRVARSAVPESQDDVGVDDTRELVTFL